MCVMKQSYVGLTAKEEEILACDVQIGDHLSLYGGMGFPRRCLTGEEGLLDQSALTGESVPKLVVKGEEVLAGSLVVSKPILMEVTKPYSDSTLAKILHMSEDAVAKKPKMERFIRRFAKVYTPIVVGLATLVVVVRGFGVG